MQNKTQTTSSAEFARDRFGSTEAAEKYAAAHRGSATDRRERRRIRAALGGLPAGARVLDLPCGAGRFLPLLHDKLRFHVTEADSSPHMVEKARQRATAYRMLNTSFAVADALDTGFDDNAFDAILCNRLFHHFSENDVRVAALREFRRISRGPIVLSFFCSYSWDGTVFHLKHALTMRSPSDRIPIRLQTIVQNARDAGLCITRILPMRPGLSAQWYLVLEHA